MVENASGATSMNVPLAGKATASPAKGEKNTKDAEANMQKQLIDLLGIKVVEQYHSKKLLFDKYCDKMLKRKKIPKITNLYAAVQKLKKDSWKELQFNLVDNSKLNVGPTVTSEYNRQATVQRTKDMITGKWTTLTCDCNKFARIVKEHARLSGENDSTWLVLCYKTSVRTAEDIKEPDELFRGDTIPRPLGSHGLRRVKNPTRPDPHNHMRWEEML
ncbi:hypothetical protein Tco_1176597 [Tanacetum coccineum]